MAGSAPKKVTLIISLVLVALSVALVLIKGLKVPFLTENAYWVAIAGYVVLFLGNLLKGF